MCFDSSQKKKYGFGFYKHVLGPVLTTRRQITRIITILTEGGAKQNDNEELAELAAA